MSAPPTFRPMAAWTLATAAAITVGFVVGAALIDLNRAEQDKAELERLKREVCEPTELVVTDSWGTTNRVYDCHDFNILGVQK